MSKKRTLVLILSFLLISFLISYLVFAWTEPGQPPPAGNVPTPINVGSTYQEKIAALGAAAFYDSDDNTFWVDPAGGAGNYAAFLKGDIGISDSAGNIMTFWKDPDANQEGILRLQSTAGAPVTDGYTIFSIDAPSANPVEAALGVVVGDEVVDLYNMNYAGATRWGLVYIRGTDTSIWKDFYISGQDLYGGPVTHYLTIDLPGGNVGIGTETPGQKLDVAGGYIKSDTGFCIGTDCITSWPAGGGGLWTDAGTYIYPNNYTSFAITDTGRLGIGTTSPDQKLSVIGVVRGAYDSAETEYTEIGHGGANGYINTVGDGKLDFRHDGSNVMRLSDTGDLEIKGTLYDLDDGNVDIGEDLIVNGWTLEHQGADFKLGTNDGRSVGSNTGQRALVHDTNDVLVINYAGDFEGGTRIDSDLTISGTARIRPPIGYQKTTTAYEIPDASEGTWIDDPMGSVTVNISGPSTLWIVYRGRLYTESNGGGCSHAYGYSKINVDGTDYGESLFAWEAGTASGDSTEKGFISSLLVDVSCASYPCTKTIKGRQKAKGLDCCPPVFGSCNTSITLVQRNLFVEAFRQ
jgi:FlaG/FlaF family flagellin (archaellin)